MAGWQAWQCGRCGVAVVAGENMHLLRCDRSEVGDDEVCAVDCIHRRSVTHIFEEKGHIQHCALHYAGQGVIILQESGQLVQGNHLRGI